MTLRVAFAGTPVFAVPALRALASSHQLVGVLTQPDRPAGRGRALAASPVKQAALELGAPVAQPLRLRGDAEALQSTLALLREWNPDVMVVVAYGLILPREVLTLPRFGCLNIHASLLPRWRGAAPIQRAILAGDAQSGVSIMQMDEGLDTGAVRSEARLALDAEITSAQLHDTLAALGAREIVQAVDALAAGRSAATAQPVDGVTYAAKLSRAESPVDWTRPARDIDRQVRAFNPWPAAETTLDGEPVKLWRSRVSEGRAGVQAPHAMPQAGPVGDTRTMPDAPVVPGTVLGLSGDALQIACGEGILQVMELQRAGRKAVGARDFLNALGGTGRPVVFQ